MIEQFAVLTRTGIVLWSHPEQPLPAKPGAEDPVASLIRNVLISANPSGSAAFLRDSDGFKAKKVPEKDRLASQVYRDGPHELKWRVDNELDLIYVVSLGLLALWRPSNEQWD